MTRLLLIDDHTAFRDALAFMLNREPGWAVVGKAGSVVEGHQIIAETPFDGAIMDLGLPDGNGTSLIREIRQRNPLAMIMALTASESRGSYVQAVAAGVSVFCRKSSGFDEIISGMRRLEAGETLNEPAIVNQML